MRYEYLINPFVRLAGTKALVLGLLLMGLTTVICFYSHCHLDGALDAHIGMPGPFWIYMVEGLLSWAVLVLSLFVAGRISSSSQVRLIDIAGTVALARAPLLFIAIAAFIPTEQALELRQLNGSLLFLALISLVFAIWMIVLLYHAYIVSCNLKGKKAVLSFIIALVCAELVSKIILNQIY